MFCLCLHYNGDDSYLFVNEKEIYKFKTSTKTVNIPTQFCLGSIYNKLGVIDSKVAYLKENLQDL